jgi:hypothetical protein
MVHRVAWCSIWLSTSQDCLCNACAQTYNSLLLPTKKSETCYGRTEKSEFFRRASRSPNGAFCLEGLTKQEQEEVPLKFGCRPCA